jgi:hypothetical protein
MITELQISIQWRELFRGAPAVDEAMYAKASALIEALPATSPLRQRYSSELSDLRRLNAPPEPRPAKRVKRRVGN